MTFQELGDILRQERLQRGLNIEEVMHETKVSRRHLEAIEDGRVEDLPHPVYVKGFVKIYAQMLGVDIKGIGALVDTAFASVLEEEHQEERRRYRPKKDIPLNVGSRKKGLPGVVVLLLALLLLGGIGYGVWYFFFQSKGEQGEIPASVEPRSEAAPETTPPAGVQNPPLSSNVGQRSVPPPSAEETAPPRPEPPLPAPEVTPDVVVPPLVGETPGDSGEAPHAAREQEGEPLLEARVEGTPEAGEGESPAVVEEALRSLQGEPMVIASAQAQAVDADEVLILDIIGKGECWIEAKVDRDFTTDFYVREGERVEVHFTRVLAVKFGNLGEVSLRYNGVPFPISVPPSGVKTLTFPPSP